MLCALVTGLSWPGLRSPLLMDDIEQLFYTRTLRNWGEIWKPDVFSLFRPVKNALFYALLPWLEGDLLRVHLVGLGCFLAGVAGVWVLARRVTWDPVLAMAVAAVWALAPTQVSSAIWLSCANIGIGVFFLCLCLVFYDKSRSEDGNWRWLLAAMPAAMLALLSYETAVAIAPMALALDWARGRITRRTAGAAVAAVGAIALTTLIYLVIRVQAGTAATAMQSNLGFEPGMEKWQVMVSAPWFLWRHVLMWFAPIGNIEFVSTYAWMKSASAGELVWGGFVWLVLLAAPFLLRKSQPLVALGIAWFLIAAFPAGNFVPLYVGPIEDYYLTVPSIGIALALAATSLAAWRGLRAGQARSPLAAVLVLLLLGLPRLGLAGFFPVWAEVWNRPAELYARVAASRSWQFQAEGLLARELAVAGVLDDARKHAGAAMAMAPWHPFPKMVLAEVNLKEKNFDEARSLFILVGQAENAPAQARELAILRVGMIYGMEEATREKAMDVHRKLLDHHPDSPYHATAAYELAKLYQARGDQARAAATIGRARQLHPGVDCIRKAFAALEAGQPLPAPDSFLMEISTGS